MFVIGIIMGPADFSKTNCFLICPLSNRRFCVLGKVEPGAHTSSFNMGYLVGPYGYPNGAGAIPVSMVSFQFHGSFYVVLLVLSSNATDIRAWLMTGLFSCHVWIKLIFAMTEISGIRTGSHGFHKSLTDYLLWLLS